MHTSKSPETFAKTQIAGPDPRVFDSVLLGCGPRVCISNKLLRDANATALGTTF